MLRYCRCHKHSIRDKGILLFEVMLTVAIVAGALVFILHAFSASLRATKSASLITNSFLLLENKLFEIENALIGKDIDLEFILSGDEGNFDQPWSGYKFKVEQSSKGEEEAEEGKKILLDALKLTVSKEEKDGRITGQVDTQTYIAYTKD